MGRVPIPPYGIPFIIHPDLQESIAPIIEPPPIVPPEQTNPIAWAMLFALFGLLGVVTFMGYAASSASLKDGLGQGENDVRAHIDAIGAGELFTTAREGRAIELPKKVLAARSTFLEWASPKGASMSFTRAKLDELREAEKLFIAVQFELGRPIPVTDLASLAKLDDPSFSKIYVAKSLTLADARNLVSQLPSSPEVENLAKVHALKKAGVLKPYLEVITRAKVLTRSLAGGVILLLLGAGVVLWVVFLSMRSQGLARPLGHPALPMSEGMADAFAGRAFLLLFGFILIAFTASMPFMRKVFSEDWGDVVMTVLCVLMLVLFSKTLLNGRRISLGSIGWTTKNLGRNILWGLGGAVANVPLLVITGLLSSLLFGWLPVHPHPISTEIMLPHSLTTFFLIAFAASIGAPIFEESLFRGMLFPAMSTRFKSMVVGVLLSSFLFAAMHPTGPPQWLPLASIGAVSAVLSYQTKSLVPSVVMHAVHNLASLIIAVALS